jgi:enamine deaminase RidA (YjgF/YER057c/UK114 family)
MSRQLIRSGSPLEVEIGFSRAVRVGSHIFIAGTAPIVKSGGVAAPGDVYGQTRRCLEIVAEALTEAGARLDHVARTRLMLVDISHWREAARAHGEFFQKVRPACTFVEVSRFIDPGWLVEIEVDAVVP